MANTAPVNASSSTIDGSAMRRLRVKNSASSQAATATAALPMCDASGGADSGQRCQQQHAGDHDEDVVESGDETEMLLVDG